MIVLFLLALFGVAGAGITIEIGSGRRRALAALKRQQEARRRSAAENDASHRTDDDEEDKKAFPPESWPPFVTRGWLWKKGHIRHNWKRRYFILSQDWTELKYYAGVSSSNEQPIGEPLGRIVLGGASARLGLDYIPKRAHVFSMTVRTKDEVYYCEAATEEERQRWVRTINTAGAARKTLWDDWQGGDTSNFQEKPQQQNAATTKNTDNTDKLPLARRSVLNSPSTPQEEELGPNKNFRQQRRWGLMTAFERSCVDAMVDDIVSYHKAKAIARAVRLLNSEPTIGKMNRALRGAYVVESIELELADPIAGVRVLSAALAKSPSAVASRLERKFRPGEAQAFIHRLSIDFEWPQRLQCTVRGIRPKGGGLPPLLRAVIPKNLLSGRHKISFSLASRLEGSSGLALDLVSSQDAPWPKLRRVTVAKLPRLHLELVEDDRGLLGFVFSFMPKEVIVSLLENAVNDAITKPGRKLAWDVLGDPGAHSSNSKKQQHEKDDSDRWLQARPMSTSTVDALRSVAAIAAQAARAAARDSALAAATVKQAAESLRSAVLDPTTIAQIEDREHDKTTENILISSADHQVSAQYIDDDNYVEDNDEDDNLNSLDAENSSEIFEEDDDDEDDEKFEETSSILNTDDNVRSPTKPNIEPIEQYDEVNNKYVENDNLNKPPAYENTVASTKSAAGEEEEEIDFDETSSNQNRTYDR
mmetsp:Transcript_20199/g.30780  ORF Transcript_20199/g.30780 Transcript_20199/m.30780 type:complete len:703 (+) Transcript_20199:25-2133(+)